MLRAITLIAVLSAVSLRALGDTPAPVTSSITPDDATEGDTTKVSLHGQNFDVRTSFLLGTVPLSRQVVSPPRFATAEVPPTLPAGEYDLVTASNDGTETLLPKAFTVHAKPKHGCASSPIGMTGLLTAIGWLWGRRRRPLRPSA